MGLLEAANTGKEILDAFLGVERELKERFDRRRSEQLCRALRAIYFTPGGVVRVLEDFAAGRAVDQNVVASVLPEFNDAEWDVSRAIEGLSFDELEGDLRVSLRVANALQSIRWGKINLRRDIQFVLNAKDDAYNHLSKKEAKTLLKRIAMLNRSIEAFEEALNVNRLDR